jgi:hypothetical protein
LRWERHAVVGSGGTGKRGTAPLFDSQVDDFKYLAFALAEGRREFDQTAHQELAL